MPDQSPSLPGGAVETAVLTTVEVQPPRQYHVVFWNDDVTTFECVIDIMVSVFGMTVQQGAAFARVVDQLGRGIAGTYARTVAETKRDDALQFARAQGYPLRVTIEPAA